MPSQDHRLSTRSTNGRNGRAPAIAFSLGAMLLAALLSACLPRPVYNETPTAAPHVAPSAAAGAVSPIATATQMPALTPTIGGPTILRLDPSVVNLAVGETRLVQVRLENVERLYAIEIHITFEPGYVNVNDANPDLAGTQISEGVLPAPVQVMQNSADNTAGLIVYQVAQVPDSSTQGSGMVASFTVQATAEGGSPLRFTTVRLEDTEGEPLPEPDPVDGLVIIGPGGVTSEPAEEPSPTETALVGTPVTPSPTGAPVAPTSTPTPASPATSGKSGIYHTVQRGENVYRIALRYGTTVDAIVAANGLADEDAVQAGQPLLVPVSPPSGQIGYVVQKGDTLFSIARYFGKSVESLATLNGIGPDYAIEVGQILVIVP